MSDEVKVGDRGYVTDKAAGVDLQQYNALSPELKAKLMTASEKDLPLFLKQLEGKISEATVELILDLRVHYETYRAGMLLR